jgi:tetratricopeptide (TPR) repeat protein
MKIRSTACALALAVAAWAASSAPASAQEKDSIKRAKDYYASAAYEEALQVIERLRPQSPAETDEAAAYQVFCLVALGRTDQAKHAIETMVRNDPMYHPPESLASPRVRTLFDDTRRPLLPVLARQSYNKGKIAYDKKDLAAAGTEFDRTIALIDELADRDDPSLADLRTLVSGFRDLCKVAPAPAAPVPPPAAAVTPPAPDPEPPVVKTPVETKAAPAATAADHDAVYGPQNTDVKAPVAISRDMPSWSPANTFEARSTATGVLEVIVNEKGAVEKATMRKTSLPSYDAALLKSAANWKFKPATLNGVAVKYRLDVSIQLGR